MDRDYDGVVQEGISVNPDGTVTLPDQPLSWGGAGSLGIGQGLVGQVFGVKLDILGWMIDENTNETTISGTFILSPSSEEGFPILSFGSSTETDGDEDFKFVGLITDGSLLLKTGINQKINLILQ